MHMHRTIRPTCKVGGSGTSGSVCSCQTRDIRYVTVELARCTVVGNDPWVRGAPVQWAPTGGLTSNAANNIQVVNASAGQHRTRHAGVYSVGIDGRPPRGVAASAPFTNRRCIRSEREVTPRDKSRWDGSTARCTYIMRTTGQEPKQRSRVSRARLRSAIRQCGKVRAERAVNEWARNTVRTSIRYSIRYEPSALP